MIYHYFKGPLYTGLFFGLNFIYFLVTGGPCQGRSGRGTWGAGVSRSSDMPGARHVRLARTDGSAMAEGGPHQKTSTTTPRGGARQGRARRPSVEV